MSNQRKVIRVVGHDPSLRNWGWALGFYDLETSELRIPTIGVIQPVLSKGKQVRQNSLDLDSARQLFMGAEDVSDGAQAVFVEVPVGSQSARAMASYGLCVGVLGALRALGNPFYEVTPSEVKMATVGIKTATKEQMIGWAMNAHPEANWPVYAKNGTKQVSEAKAEHMADAIAAIYAGINTTGFQQLLPFLKQGVSFANSVEAA